MGLLPYGRDPCEAAPNPKTGCWLCQLTTFLFTSLTQASFCRLLKRKPASLQKPVFGFRVEDGTVSFHFLYI